MSDNKDRSTDHRFKLLYAIAMIQIVSGHCQDGALDLFYEWIPYMGTHLAILIFASGYFYKDSSGEEPLKFLWKKTKRLLIPLYIWNLVYGLLVMGLKHFGFSIGGELTLKNLLLAPLYDGHQFGFNLAGWFVVPLFMAEAAYMFYRLLLKKLKLHLPETLVFLPPLIVGIAGLQLANMGYHKGWWLMIPRFAYFFAFYAMGAYYKRAVERYDRLPNIIYFGLIALIQMGMLFVFHRIPIYVISWCEDFPEGPVVPFITGTLGIAFWLRICKWLEWGLGKDKTVNAIADNSYSIMIHQFMGFMAVKTVYALFAKYTGHFLDFDMAAYKSDLWYYYTPPQLPYYSLIFYLAAGIALPVGISVLGRHIKNMIPKRPGKV
ncbi:MAG: acyltransferase [Lachnospiraceae bacterium]|nr:acyltransferase [Lachnospiraceae bacterium]